MASPRKWIEHSFFLFFPPPFLHEFLLSIHRSTLTSSGQASILLILSLVSHAKECDLFFFFKAVLAFSWLCLLHLFHCDELVDLFLAAMGLRSSLIIVFLFLECIEITIRLSLTPSCTIFRTSSWPPLVNFIRHYFTVAYTRTHIFPFAFAFMAMVLLFYPRKA